MLSGSSSSLLVARSNSANSKIKKLMLTASLFLLNSILLDQTTTRALAVSEAAKTETGIVRFTETQPTENE